MLRWDRVGSDLRVTITGPLRLGTEGADRLATLRTEIVRFAAEELGRVIVDLAGVPEADQRSVFALLEALQPVRECGRVGFQGRGSAIAAMVAGGELPWFESIGEAPGDPRPDHWEAMVDALPDALPERPPARSDIWGSAAATIEAMLASCDEPGTEESSPADRAPPPAPSARPRRQEMRKPPKDAATPQTEELSIPLLWFDHGLDDPQSAQVTGSAPTPPPRGQPTPLRGVSPIDGAPPPGQDVFEWFFSVGEEAVRGSTSNLNKSSALPAAPETPRTAPPGASLPFMASTPPTPVERVPIPSAPSPAAQSPAAQSPSVEDEAAALFGGAPASTAPEPIAPKSIPPAVTALPPIGVAPIEMAAPRVSSITAIEATATRPDPREDFHFSPTESETPLAFETPAAVPRDVEADAEEESDDFVIDLEMERLYLTRSPNRRDHVVGENTLTFNQHYRPLSRGDEVVPAPPRPAHRPDPVELLLRQDESERRNREATAASHFAGPIDEGDRREGEAPRSASVKSGWSGTGGYSVERESPPAPPEAPRRSVRAPIPHAAHGPDSIAPRPPAAPAHSIDHTGHHSRSLAPPRSEQDPRSAPSSSRSAAEGEAMLRGVARMLSEYGESDREREQLEAICKSLAIENGAKEQELASLRREVEELRQRGTFGPQVAAASDVTLPGWLAGLAVAPCNPEPQRLQFSGTIARFRASGAVDPEEVLRAIAELNQRAPRIAATVRAQLERGLQSPGDGWRALLLVVSTLVREGAEPDRRRRAIRIAWLASLVRNAPGTDSPDPMLVGPAVARLLAGRPYRFPGEDGRPIDPREADLDLALWMACTRLDERRHLTPKRWRREVGRTLATYEDVPAIRGGLARLVEAHSLYFPGTWVELTTGGIGPVIGAIPGRPELPRVLVLFRRDGVRGASTPPHLFPAGEDSGAAVFRVLTQPHVAEEDRNSLAIDAGGSVAVPKKR